MAFDLATAKPVEQQTTGGFDLSTAKPVSNATQDQQPQDQSTDTQGTAQPFIQGWVLNMLDNPVWKGIIKQAAPDQQTADNAISQIESGAHKFRVGTGQTALTVGSGMAGEAAGGVAGIGSLMRGQGVDHAVNTIDTVKNALSYTPTSPEGQQYLQGVGQGMEAASKAVDYPLSGLGGMAELATGQGIDQAGKTVSDIQNKGISQTMGDRTMEVTGSPAAASIAKATPTAVMMAAGLGGSGKAATEAEQAAARAARVAKDAADIARVRKSLGIGQKTAEAVQSAKPQTAAGEALGSVKSGAPPESSSYQEIVNGLKTEKLKQTVKDAMPDNEIMSAAQDLGIDLNPDHYSSNRTFQEVVQALKGRPGSKLGAVEADAIKSLGQRADQLISDIGGQTDKSLLDANVKSDFSTVIDHLNAKSDLAYNVVNKAIPKSTLVAPKASKMYLWQTLQDLGGDKTLLSPAESKLLTITQKNPTYSALDRLRKDVGNGFKRQGPYKDEASGTLKQVYAALSEDQQGVADSFGVGSDYATARKLVQSRKQVEDQSIALFGREVGGSIVPKIKSAAKALTQGDISKFNNLMRAIPKNRRSEAAATMLNDIFAQGTRSDASLSQGFVKAIDGLDRNANAKKILFRELPPEARIRYEKIATVAKGIFRSKALGSTSNSAAPLILAMDNAGFFGKAFEIGRTAAVAEGATTALHMPGVGSTAVLVKALMRGKTTATEAADNFVTSAKFKQAIIKSVQANNPAKADQILKSSTTYKRWKTFLSPSQSAELAKVGIIGYLTSDGQSQQGN